MTLAQLANFVRVAELASFSKAAAVVRIAQPALSRQVRLLELELGADLFVRHAWGVTVTEPGAALLDHARRILREVELTRDTLDALSVEPTGRIAVGVPATLASCLLPPLAVALRDKFPRLKPRFVDDFSAGLHARVHAGELDLALLYAEKTMGPVATEPLLTETLSLIVSPGPRRDAVDILAKGPVVLSARPSRLREIVDVVLAVHGSDKTEVLEVDSLPALVVMVARGVGCTILPYSTVASEVDRGDLRALCLPEPRPTRALLLARPLARPPSSATRAVEAELVSLVRELSPRYGWAPAAKS